MLLRILTDILHTAPCDNTPRSSDTNAGQGTQQYREVKSSIQGSTNPWVNCPYVRQFGRSRLLNSNGKGCTIHIYSYMCMAATFSCNLTQGLRRYTKRVLLYDISAFWKVVGDTERREGMGVGEGGARWWGVWGGGREEQGGGGYG